MSGCFNNFKNIPNNEYLVYLNYIIVILILDEDRSFTYDDAVWVDLRLAVMTLLALLVKVNVSSSTLPGDVSVRHADRGLPLFAWL